MIRFTLVELSFLAIPFLLFFAYRGFLIRHKQMEGEAFSPVPYHKLFVAGGVLSLIIFLVLAFSNKKITDQVYVPAHMENGELIPGHFVDPESK
jgi:drug/metabolite transporter (DMT)-like permease